MKEDVIRGVVEGGSGLSGSEATNSSKEGGGRQMGAMWPGGKNSCR